MATKLYKNYLFKKKTIMRIQFSRGNNSANESDF